MKESKKGRVHKEKSNNQESHTNREQAIKREKVERNFGCFSK